MKSKVKVVAKTRSGEVLKGFVNSVDLDGINRNQSVYLELAEPENTVGTMICKDQLLGLYMVRSFDGNKPGLLMRLYYDTRRVIRDNSSTIVAAIVIVTFSLFGLIALL